MLEEKKKELLSKINNNTIKIDDLIENLDIFDMNDKDILKDLINRNGYYLVLGNNEIRNDEELVLKAISNLMNKTDYKNLFKFINKKLLNNKNFLIKEIILTETAIILDYVDEEVFEDKEFMIKAEAIDRTDDVSKHISKTHSNDKDFLYQMELLGGINCLEFASEELQDDKRFVMSMIDLFSGNIEFASERLKDDFDIVELAVSRNGNNLLEASSRLRKNEEIVIKSIENDLWLDDDKEELLIDKELRNNENVMIKAIKVNPYTYNAIGEELNNKTFDSKIVKILEKEINYKILDTDNHDEYIKKASNILEKINSKTKIKEL